MNHTTPRRFLALLCAMLLCLTILPAAAEGITYGQQAVVMERARICSDSGASLGYVAAGTEVTCLGGSGDEVNIRTVTGGRSMTGWVKRSALGVISGRELYVSAVSASTFIENRQDPDLWIPERMLDGQWETSWQFNRNRYAYADFEFDQPVELTAIEMKNGFWRVTNGYDQYTRNGRLRSAAIRLTYANGRHESFTFSIPETFDWQSRSLGVVLEINRSNVVSVRLLPTGYRIGTRFTYDIAISAMTFYGN